MKVCRVNEGVRKERNFNERWSRIVEQVLYMFRNCRLDPTPFHSPPVCIVLMAVSLFRPKATR
jgi:hypothetical protein